MLRARGWLQLGQFEIQDYLLWPHYFWVCFCKLLLSFSLQTYCFTKWIVALIELGKLGGETEDHLRKH